MTTPKPLRGVITFPVTPLKDDGRQIDEARFRQLLDFLIDNSLHGLVVIGSTGAVGSFTEEERRRLARVAVEHVNHRVPVFVGTGAMTTDEAVRLSRHAEDVGADGLQVVPMSHWPLTDSEIYDHYREIASVVSIPILVHNCPGLTGIDIRPPMLARLAEIENIRYFKEGSGDLTRITSLRRLTRTAIIVHDHEATALQGLVAGAEIWGSLMANIIPRPCVELFELAVEKRDIDGARDLFERMFPLIEFMSQRSAVRVFHTAFELMGRPVGPPRRPLRLLGPEDRAQLDRLLREFGALGRRAGQ